jgi:hypothetical protein
VLKGVFDSIGLYSAIKLANLFPEPFKPQLRALPLAERHSSNFFYRDSAIDSKEPNNLARYRIPRKLTKTQYDNINSRMLEYLELFAKQMLVSNGEGKRRVTAWVFTKGPNRGKVLSLPEDFVEGYRNRQDFLSLNILFPNQHWSNKYFRRRMEQYAEELEINRLGGELRLNMCHRRKHDVEEAAAARKHLVAVNQGRRRGATFGSGTFSSLYSRFESVQRNLAQAALADHVSALDAWMAELGDTESFVLRAVKAAAVIYYGVGEATRSWNYYGRLLTTPRTYVQPSSPL